MVFILHKELAPSLNISVVFISGTGLASTTEATGFLSPRIIMVLRVEQFAAIAKRCGKFSRLEQTTESEASSMTY